MKQKIVIKLQMGCDKCRNKALKTAAEVKGVTSVTLEGDDKDCVVVTGDNVDTIFLANQMKKKFRCVIILSVEEVKKPVEVKKPDEVKKPADKKKVEEKKKEEEKCCVVLYLPPCTKFQSSIYHAKCDTCSECHNSKCDGKCVTKCFKCQSPNCKGHCKPCFKCHNSNCLGKCPCPNCHNNKCHGCNEPPPPNFHPCPPWCTCPRCYVPYPPPCDPYPPCHVVYDSYHDSCSIM